MKYLRLDVCHGVCSETIKRPQVWTEKARVVCWIPLPSSGLKEML